MDKLIGHIENHLGPIIKGWSRLPESEERLPFQLIQTQGLGSTNSCFSTLGLSKESLRNDEKNKTYFQEIFVCTNSAPKNLPAVLISLGLELLSSKRALLRGEVVGPHSGAVISGTKFSALYVAEPVYWSDDFWYYTCDGITIIFCWLVPIFSQEAAFIKMHGWSRFEDQIMKINPDMCDLNRTSIIP